MSVETQSVPVVPIRPHQGRERLLVRAARAAERGFLVSLEDRSPAAFDEDSARVAAEERVAWFEEWGRRGLPRGLEVVVRPSLVGAGLGWSGEQRAMEHVDAMASAARAVGGAVTLEVDDPDGPAPDVVLEMAMQLRREHPTLGISLAAELSRTEDDCRALAHEGSRVRLRRHFAARRGEERHEGGSAIDLAYVRCLRTLLAGGGSPRVASHDRRLIRIAGALAATSGREQGDHEYEFAGRAQWRERERLLDSGESVRVRFRVD